jgi:hypothetical protein
VRTSAAIIWAVRVAARGAPPVPLRGPLRPLAIIKLIFKLGAFVALPLKEAHALVAGKRPRKPKSCQAWRKLGIRGRLTNLFRQGPGAQPPAKNGPYIG